MQTNDLRADCELATRFFIGGLAVADRTKPDARMPPSAGVYTVGYKKPPAEHQFKSKQLRDRRGDFGKSSALG